MLCFLFFRRYCVSPNLRAAGLRVGEEVVIRVAVLHTVVTANGDKPKATCQR